MGADMWRQTSARGREMIEEFEGRRNKAYRDVGGVYTCGIGCTGPDIGAETVWTDAEVEEHFTAALRRFEIGINKLVLVPLTQNMWDSICSISYNIGLSALKSSTLLRKLNARNYTGAADEFLRWDKVGGKTVSGLTRRRIAERELFLKNNGV
jgi:lysozyme